MRFNRDCFGRENKSCHDRFVYSSGFKYIHISDAVHIRSSFEAWKNNPHDIHIYALCVKLNFCDDSDSTKLGDLHLHTIVFLPSALNLPLVGFRLSNTLWNTCRYSRSILLFGFWDFFFLQIHFYVSMVYSASANTLAH